MQQPPFFCMRLFRHNAVSLIFRLAIATIALLCFQGEERAYARQLFSLRGSLHDSSTGLSLPAGTVRILGTPRGTIVNSRGEYVLTLLPGEYVIGYSCLGYEPDTARLVIAGDIRRDVFLRPSLVRFPEVLVYGEDPAVEIIRKAIAHKREWQDRLHSYRFDAFTRQVLWRDTAIASIAESYTQGFQQVGDTLRELVLQKRQTRNIPLDENAAAVRNIINFNDDEINPFTIRANDATGGYSFVGPTAPDALEHYDYKLLRTSSIGGIDTYEIRMIPQSRLRPLFDGIITIAEGTFAVVGVDLKPNEALVIPFLREIDLRFEQQFALYDSAFWMPADIRIHGGFTISIVGFSLPRISIDQISSIYRYEINTPVPDSMSHKASLTVDSAAGRFDSTFWKSTEVLPLTPEERLAYHTLDSSQTLDKQFEPKGPLAALTGSGTPDLFGHLDVHYNRVEGFYLGTDFPIPRIPPYLLMTANAGTGFADERIKYRVGVTVFTSSSRKIGIGVEAYRAMDHISDGGFYGPFAISLMALIDKNDYRNYFFVNGWRSFLTFASSGRTESGMRGELEYLSEQQSTVLAATHYSFFSGNELFRPNPSIDDGLLRSIRCTLRFGAGNDALGLIARRGLDLSAEHSSPSLTGSDFHFTQYRGTIAWTFPTMYQSLLFRPQLRVQASGGVSSGSAPVQRFFFLDTRSSGYAPFGVLRGGGVAEYSGDAFFMLTLEHNFRTIPFLLLHLPFLYRNGIDFVLHGALAQSWAGARSTTDGWYAEAGCGLSRIFDLLRADLTYRFRDPRRLYFSLSLATLF